MGSKFIVPLELPNYNVTPTNTADPSFGLVYLKDDWLKRALNLSIEQDLVLEHPLDNFSVLGTGNASALSVNDTVEQAFNKLQQSLYIKLVGDVTGTAAYSGGNLQITTTVVNGGSSIPLAATKFDVQHYTTPLGNPYLIGDIVYYNGHIFRAIANNDAIPPAIGGNAYWTDLGAGYPYRQNVANWTATSGDTQIINKPTTLSAFTNDVGFLTTETDPVFSASAASGISSTDVTNWNTAYTNMDKAHTVYATVYATEDIPPGRVVNVISGYTLDPSTGMPSVANADNTSEATSDKVLGIAPLTINNGDVGEVITKGPIYGLDTHAASVGYIAWLNTAGSIIYTATMAGRPAPPNHAIYLGVVTISDPSNGSIYVDIQNGFELSELHDVSASTPTDNDVLSYNASTGLWENTSISTLVTGTSPLTTKGDLYTFNSTNTRLPVGLDTQVLIADSSTATGLKWGTNTTPTPTGYYGAWQDDFTQTAPSSNTGVAMNFHTADIPPNGISIVNNGSGNPTRITFANTGIYNLQFSSQFQNADNQLHDVTIWLRLNGVDIDGSSGFISVPNSHGGTPGHIIGAWNYVISVVAGQYYELVWSTTDHTHVSMQYYAAGSPPPAAASVILTITQQAGIMAGTGITALNALTGSAQTLVTGTTGTDFNIASSGTIHTFNLPTASASVRGALSSADWSTFNSKQTALGYTPVPTTRTLTINGTTQDLSADRTFTVSAGNTAGINLANYYNFF